MAATERSTTNALRRIPITQIASSVDLGAAAGNAVTASCPDNSGLAQHEIVIDGGDGATVVGLLMRPMDCTYFVAVARVVPPCAYVFRGLLDAVKLHLFDTSASLVISAKIASVATTFNSSAGEAFDEKWRRRPSHTSIITDWPSNAGKACPTHQLLSQHQLSVGGGSGTVQFYGSNGGSALQPVGRSMDSGGDFQIITGYYDHFAVQGAPSATGSVQADVHSIAQELITGEADTPNGSPMLVPDGQVFVVPVNDQMLWQIPIEVIGNGGLDIQGALVEVGG